MKYAFLGLFVIIMVVVGLYSRKKVTGMNDFLLGGRNMGPWITAFAYGTTYFSAVLFIGYAGNMGWNFGISVVWIGLGNALLGSLLAWKVLAKRTRAMTHHLEAATMPSFFENRYQSRGLKIATAIIIFVFMVPYSASVYQGLGYVFENTFNIPFMYAMLAMAVLTGLYLLLGGYIATALNDLIQGLVMVGGLLLMIFYVLKFPAVGGLAEGLTRLGRIDPDFIAPFSSSPVNLLALVVLTSLGTWGLPQMVHKFYTIRDQAAIKRGTIISTVFCTFIAVGTYFTGAFGRLVLNNTKPDGISDRIMPNVLSTALPEGLMSVIIILILSASMSTLSSLVLVSSSAISVDLVKGVLMPKISARANLGLMRFLCVLFVALSFLVAMTKNAIITLMSFSWGTIAGAFLAPFLYGLYWKKATKAGAWVGFFTGVIISVAGAILFGPSKAPLIGAVAMVVPLGVVPLVSLITPKLPRDHIQYVFQTGLSKPEGI
ncbi:MAG TPA: sodium:solute symporter [Clostridiales bacterium]|nr:sodium:solute symporter [Clostridiales bacterium]